MSKKKGIFVFICLIVLFSILINAGEILDGSKIGDKEEYEVNETKDDLTYTEVKDRELIGYEIVYKEICENTTKYNSTEEKFDTWENCSTVIDEKVEGDPIYVYTDIKAVEYDEIRYDFVEKGCSICKQIKYETGQTREGYLLLCLSNYDGYSTSINECFIEDGVSFKIKDLISGKILDSDGHFEVNIEN